MNFAQLLTQGDAVSQGVALLLLLMSLASWVVIVWKVWFLRRVRLDVTRSTAAFWQSASLDAALAPVATGTEQASAPHPALFPQRCRASGATLSPRSGGERRKKGPAAITRGGPYYSIRQQT